MEKNPGKIDTIIKCPKCGTITDVEDIKRAVIDKIYIKLQEIKDLI